MEKSLLSVDWVLYNSSLNREWFWFAKHCLLRHCSNSQWAVGSGKHWFLATLIGFPAWCIWKKSHRLCVHICSCWLTLSFIRTARWGGIGEVPRLYLILMLHNFSVLGCKLFFLYWFSSSHLDHICMWKTVSVLIMFPRSTQCYSNVVLHQALHTNV